jgi:hypothetical protein
MKLLKILINGNCELKIKMITLEQLFPELIPTEMHYARLNIVNEWAQLKFEAGEYETLEEAEIHCIRVFKECLKCHGNIGKQVLYRIQVGVKNV